MLEHCLQVLRVQSNFIEQRIVAITRCQIDWILRYTIQGSHSYTQRQEMAGGISTTSPPIHLYHPLFGRFIQIVEDPNVQLTDEGFKNIQELMHYLSEIFWIEREYAQGLRQRLYKILQANILHGKPRCNVAWFRTLRAWHSMLKDDHGVQALLKYSTIISPLYGQILR